ncbi:MAG: hypothetical protein ACOYB3_01560 [Azonexus sp.]
MDSASKIVDILLEADDADTDMEAFVRGAGVMSPGLAVSKAFESAKAEKTKLIQNSALRSGGAWFYTPEIRFGTGKYHVNSNIASLKTYCRCEVSLPDEVKQTFGLFSAFGPHPIQIRNTVSVPSDPEAVRDGIDKLYRWATQQLQKWDDLVFIRQTFKRIKEHDLAGSVGLEFRQKFNPGAMAEWEYVGYAKSSIPTPKAAKMRAWLQARLQQLGIHESEEPAPTQEPEQMNLGIDMDKFLRDAGVTVSMDDFVIRSSPQRCMGYSNGNTDYYVSYKRLLYKGKPVYLGRICGYHDYNRTGHSGHAGYFVDVPTTMKAHYPMNKRTGQRYKRAKYRTYQGYGAVRFNKQETGKQIESLFDGCKYLLSLLKIQHPLKQAESLVDTLLS